MVALFWSMNLKNMTSKLQSTQISEKIKNQMPILIPQTDYPELIDIINETYTDGLDRILAAEVADDDSIVCVGQDGVKQIAVKITDTDIQIRLIDPNQIEGGTARFTAPKQDTPDRIATNLQKLGDPIVGGWLRQIEQMLATSDDLETAREALFQLYPDLDSTDLAEQMTDAMAAASMAGFWEAGSETGEEAEFAKIPEGTTRRRDGVSQVLKNSRWHNEESEESDVKKKNPST
jgi:hypothetical protein